MLVGQTLTTRSDTEPVGSPRQKLCDPDCIALAVEGTQGSSIGSPSEVRAEDGFKLVRRRKNRRVGIVVIRRGGDAPLLWSADESEKRKILVWASHLPPVVMTRKRLSECIAEALMKSVVLIRNFGKGKDRRVEILCESTESRDLVLEELRTKPLGFPGERLKIGRSFSERNSALQTRMREDKVTRGNEGPRVANRFAPLVDREEGDDMSLRVAVLNMNELSELFAPLWKQADVVRPTVLAVTETYRHVEDGSYHLSGYKFFENRMRFGSRRRVKVDEDSHGVGFFVKNDWSSAFCPLEIPVKFADCLWLKLSRDCEFNKGLTHVGANHHVRVRTQREIWFGVYYFSPSLSEAASLACVNELSTICELAGQRGAEVVILGDLNCCLRAVDDPLRRLHDGYEQTKRSELLRQLLEVGLRLTRDGRSERCAPVTMPNLTQKRLLKLRDCDLRSVMGSLRGMSLKSPQMTLSLKASR